MADEHLTEEEDAILNRIGELHDADDIEGIREIFRRHPGVLCKRESPHDRMGFLWQFLQTCAGCGELDLVKLCVEYGADINAYDNEKNHEGAINRAAGKGHIEVMRWLLDQGAVFQQERDGRMTSMTLIRSAQSGQLAEVKLLLERGAPVNGLSYNGLTALDFAETYKHREVAELLRSRGGLHGWEVQGLPPPRLPEPPATLRAHLAATLGKADELSLREVVPSGAPVVIHRVVRGDEQFLVTEGMSAAAMTPPGSTAVSRFAEVYFRLPAGWPLTAEALADPRRGWPVEWLRRVARLPHDGPFWLDSDGALLSAADPPAPLAPDTRLCSVLAVLGGAPWDDWRRPGGDTVRLFLLFPIYPEEKELAEREGIRALIERLDEYGVPMIVDPQRENVALGD
jgi:hypothetical protein